MKNNYKYIGLFIGLLAFGFVACDDNIDPIREELDVDRVFSPLGLTAVIRNSTTIELNWSVRDDADHYMVEFSEDSLEFNNIIRTVTVKPNELPLQETFFGDTRYSARVKGVSADGASDSKWSSVTIKTAAENIFLPLQNGDVGSLEATLRWPENSEVTHFVVNPGNTERVITDEEDVQGMATITGLSGYTEYVVTLYSGSSHRGLVEFRTLTDLSAENVIEVHPEDNLSTVIAAASPESILVLNPGDYLAYSGTIAIDKSITIRGRYPYDKPQIHVGFSLQAGVQAVEVEDIEMIGDGSIATVFEYPALPTTSYGSLNVVGCSIHDYTKSLFGGSSMTSSVESISVSNSVVYNIVSSGGDFIDFRAGHVKNLNLVNNTFFNCAPDRDFIRLDNSSANFPGSVSNVLIDHCTLYKVSGGSSSRRILYVRFVENTLTVKNTVIAESAGIYTNQSLSTQPVCTNNNYFNAPGLHTADYVSNVKIDNSDYTTLDPGFTDAAAGNFTVTNQALIDANIGDPRWLP